MFQAIAGCFKTAIGLKFGGYISIITMLSKFMDWNYFKLSPNADVIPQNVALKCWPRFRLCMLFEVGLKTNTAEQEIFHHAQPQIRFENASLLVTVT